MKRIYLYLIIIVACILSSCNLGGRGNSVLPIELVQAENIMYENPDSALHILQTMPIPTEKEAHATWALFLTQAKYKCFIDQSDSLVNIAYDFFMKGSNAQRKALALYHRAALYEEKNQTENALTYYLEAVDIIDTINDDRLRYLIYAKIAFIYSNRKLYDYADTYMEKAMKCALSSQDNYYIANSYNNMARLNYAKKNYTLAIKYYDKAIEFGRINQNQVLLNNTIQEKTSILIKQGKIKEAQLMIDTLKHSKQASQTHLVLGYLYAELNQVDSAYFYLNKASLSDNIYTQRTTFQALFNLSKRIKDYENNSIYTVKLWNVQDSINKIERNRVLIEMQEKYNQQKVINEKNKAERRGLIILCISMGIIGIIVACYQGIVLHKNKELEDKREELSRLQERVNENNSKIVQNKKRLEMVAEVAPEDITEELQEKEAVIKNMQQQNENLQRENDRLQDKIEEHIAVLQKKSNDSERLNDLVKRNAYLRKRETYLSSQLLKMDEMITNLKQEPDCLKDYQWQELKDKTDNLFDGYTERLMKAVPTLTAHDIRICCLIKLSFSHVAIADILSISPTSLSRQKQRMKERIIQQVGSLGDNVLLDIWLKEF